MAALAFEAATGQPWDKAAHGWNRHALIIRTWLAQAAAAMLASARIGPHRARRARARHRCRRR